MSFIQVDGHRLEYEWRGAQSRNPDIVMLHEGLGSVALWKDFPAQLAESTRRRVLVYSRYGYGASDPLKESREVGFMHDEALAALPELLDKLDVSSPILFGHSDGGSIALIHAAAARRKVSGIVVLAPHVLVEDISIASIKLARRDYESADLRQNLARYHSDVDSAFWGWNDIWLHSNFREWHIEELLASILCPVLAIQGHDDKYGTMKQIDSITKRVDNVTLLKLENCGHSPHKDQPEIVLQAAKEFVIRVEQIRQSFSAAN